MRQATKRVRSIQLTSSIEIWIRTEKVPHVTLPQVLPIVDLDKLGNLGYLTWVRVTLTASTRAALPTPTTVPAMIFTGYLLWCNGDIDSCCQGSWENFSYSSSNSIYLGIFLSAWRPAHGRHARSYLRDVDVQTGILARLEDEVSTVQHWARVEPGSNLGAPPHCAKH